MRIRKRQVPLPLSSLSPVPLSDPLSSSSYLVQLRSAHDDEKADGPTSSQPPDRPNRPSRPVRPEMEGRDSSDSAAAPEENKRKRDFLELLQQEEEEDGGEKKGNDSSALAVEYPRGSLANSSPSHQAERWCEVERVFPPKKRRGNLGDTAMLDVKDSGSKKMKPAKLGNVRVSKKDVRRDDVDEDDDGEFEDGRGQAGGEEKKTVVGIESSGAKKRGRGGALMEGSRCSRVNGRGWRCCQQTLVGYSLCEHHLGKGRLRSMTSVRSKCKRPNLSSSSRAKELLPEGRAPDSLSKVEGPDDGDEEDDGDIEEKVAVRKKVKLGMVKARSMSSLLGQASGATATADADADAQQ